MYCSSYIISELRQRVSELPSDRFIKISSTVVCNGIPLIQAGFYILTVMSIDHVCIDLRSAGRQVFEWRSEYLFLNFSSVLQNMAAGVELYSG